MNRLLIRIWTAWVVTAGLSIGTAAAWTIDVAWVLEGLQARETAADRIVSVTIEMDLPTAAWVEITPLTNDELATVLRWQPTSDAEAWQPPLGLFADGTVLLCGGAEERAVTCSSIVLGSDVLSSLTLEQGLEVTGRYLLDGLPVADARVAVVPAGLAWSRPFIMPLGPSPEAGGENPVSTSLRRAVATDDGGHFRLPQLAQGRYQLETVLPNGRVHHSEAFDVPEVSDGRRQLGAFGDPAPAWDLGEILVDDGLEIAFEVIDPDGNPLVGATVFGRQGALPRELVVFESRTDLDGYAVLSGFDVDLPVQVGCRAPGFRDQKEDHALLPVLVDCALAPLSGIVGKVVGPEDLPPPGTQIVLRAFDERELADPPPPSAAETLASLAFNPKVERVVGTAFGFGLGIGIDRVASVATRIDIRDERPLTDVQARETVGSDGRFKLAGVEPGHYRIDIGAPGHAGDRYEVVLDASGSALDLGTIRLLRGQQIKGVVIAADSAEPLDGVSISVVEPPGPSATETDSNGRFELVSGDGGPVTIEAWLDGYARGRFDVGIEALEADEPLTFRLAKGGRILAVLWDAETGIACAGCSLRVMPGGHDLTTDGAGEALSDVLIPGRYRVERAALVHRGSSVVERPRAEIRYAQVRFGGVVPVWFGERRQPVSVRVSPLSEGVWYLSARGQNRRLRLVPEPDGRYLLALESGEVLHLYLEQYDPGSGFLAEVRVGKVEGAAEVDPRPTDLVLPLASGVVTALVRRDGGRAARLPVRLLALADRTLIAAGGTDEEGHLRLGHVPPGVYALEIDGVPARMISVGIGQILDLGNFDLFPRR